MAKKITRTIKTLSVKVTGIKNGEIVNDTITIPDTPEKKRDDMVRAAAMKKDIMVAYIGNYEEVYSLYACTEEEFLSVAKYVGAGRKSDAE